MAKIPCEIIRDLLPLYQDDICSEKSRNAIEEHIKECESCRTYQFVHDGSIAHINLIFIFLQNNSLLL